MAIGTRTRRDQACSMGSHYPCMHCAQRNRLACACQVVRVKRAALSNVRHVMHGTVARRPALSEGSCRHVRDGKCIERGADDELEGEPGSEHGPWHRCVRSAPRRDLVVRLNEGRRLELVAKVAEQVAQ